MLNIKSFKSVAIFLLFWGTSCYAIGIRTYTADFFITNLKIGQTYNLTQIAGTQYKVEIVGGKESMDIVLKLLAPGNTNQTGPGYEPVPDISWIKLSRNNITAYPGEIVTSDIIISIPNDNKYFGKKYEFFLQAGMKPPKSRPGTTMGVSPGVQSSIKFSIGDKPATPEEIEKLKKTELKMLSLNFTPTEIVLNDVSVGKKFDVKKNTGQSLKLVNSGDETVKFKVSCVPIGKTELVVPPEYEPQPDVNFIKLSNEKVSVKPLNIKEVNFDITFPDSEKYKNKKYIFIIEAEVEGEVVITKYHSRIFVNTQ